MASGPTTAQPPNVSVAFAAAGCTVAALCIVALRVDAGDPSATARGLALCFLPYGVLLFAQPPSGPLALRVSLCGATVAGVCMVACDSVLSDDVHRYLWDGRMWLSGRDAYALPPDHASLSSLRTADFAHINHSHIPTLYPPLSQALFALTAALWAHPAAFKLVALGCHLLTIVTVGRIARSSPGADAGARATLLLSLNPLCLSEAALGGHVDAAVGLGVAALALSLASNRTGRAIALTGALAGLKLVGAVLMPLLWRLPRGRLAVGVALSLSLLGVVPPLTAGYGDDSSAAGLSHYAQRWRGNEGPFRLLEAVVAPIGPLLATGRPTAPIGPGELQLRFLQGPLSLWPTRNVFAEEGKAPRPPATFARAHVTFMLARGLSLALVFAIAVVAIRRRWSAPSALRAVLWTLLLTSPQLHPWYLLWLLPVDIALGKRAAILWSATALIAYAPLTDWQLHRVWQDSPWAIGLQYVPVIACLIIEMRGSTPSPTCGSPLTATTGTD